jgi:5-methylcytosine-specific restriction endonuclease McrA
MTDEERKEHKRQYNQEYYEENKEANAQRCVAYYGEHREQILEHVKKWRSDNREEISARRSALYWESEERRTKMASYNSTYRKEHPEIRIAWTELHRERIVETNRHWRLGHRMLCRFRVREYRALKVVNTPIDEMLTLGEWKDILQRFDYRCAYCGHKLRLDGTRWEVPEQDHVIPLSKGGKHTKANIVPACRHCNASKNKRTPREWKGLDMICEVAPNG